LLLTGTFQLKKFLTDNIRKLDPIMAKIKITQVKSAIDRPKRQKDTLKALGLRKMHQTVEHEATPQILGMVNKVNHLVTVQEA
jgi:large subunit ribosomal protein L30